MARGNINVRDNNGITIDQLKADLPAIFTQEKATNCSEKYTYISTEQILDRLLQEGFSVVQAMQTKSKYSKHLLRFRHKDALSTTNKETPEIVYINSHDTSTSHQIMNGIFRFICSNGMICGDIQNTYRIRHSGDVLELVAKSVVDIAETNINVLNFVDKMKSTQLEHEQALEFSKVAIKARYGIPQDRQVTEFPIPPEVLLESRRDEDRGKDVFTILNVVQENSLKGGMQYLKTTGKSEGKSATIKQIGNIDQTIVINRTLWDYAMSCITV